MTLHENPYEPPRDLEISRPSTPQEMDGPVVSLVLVHLAIVALHILQTSVATKRLKVSEFLASMLDYTPLVIAVGTFFVPVFLLYILLKRKFSLQTRVTSVLAECFFLGLQSVLLTLGQG